MWLTLLARFWKPLAGLALLIGSGWYLHHQGFESGHAASEAHWQALFATAERERDAANERARKTEESSREVSDHISRQHDETIASLNLRAADAERRTAGLVRQLSARARCSALPPSSGTASIPDATSPGDERLAGAADRFTDLARRCEADAATLKELQTWIIAQRALLK